MNRYVMIMVELVSVIYFLCVGFLAIFSFKHAKIFEILFSELCIVI